MKLLERVISQRALIGLEGLLQRKNISLRRSLTIRVQSPHANALAETWGAKEQDEPDSLYRWYHHSAAYPWNNWRSDISA
jgi:hypothetical protein